MAQKTERSTGPSSRAVNPTVIAEAKRVAEQAGIDDPVRQYLNRIGQVALLTASDERYLARQMEEWLHIVAIEELLFEETGREPNPSEILVQLFREFQQEREIYRLISKYLDLPRQSVLERIQDAKFRECIDGVLDERALNKLTESTGWADDRVKAAIVNMSIITTLMKPEYVEWAS